MDERSLERIDAIRRFNRFYTRRLGLLDNAFLGSGLSLAEVRVVWELGHNPRGISATHLESSLGLDAGYVSRILREFREHRLVQSTRAAHDGRIRHLELTPKGRTLLAQLEGRSRNDVKAAIDPLSGGEQDRLVDAMRTIESLLQGKRGAWPFVLRDPRPGDYGWVIHRHGALYGREYGWDATFEALVAEIVAKYIREHDAGREHCWIAESEGAAVGCIFLVRRSAKVAQLRLLLVEPAARGLGVGAALVAQCIRFARDAGYRRMMLWTNSVLHSARHIYERAGFKLVKQERHRSFGKDLVGQYWELNLLASSRASQR